MFPLCFILYIGKYNTIICTAYISRRFTNWIAFTPNDNHSSGRSRLTMPSWATLPLCAEKPYPELATAHQLSYNRHVRSHRLTKQKAMHSPFFRAGGPHEPQRCLILFTRHTLCSMALPTGRNGATSMYYPGARLRCYTRYAARCLCRTFREDWLGGTSLRLSPLWR